MGKRSSFARRKNDAYATIDLNAVLPMIRIWRSEGVRLFAEPCAGDRSLQKMIEAHGFACVWTGDIEPKTDDGMCRMDARLLSRGQVSYCDAIITNPPWSRPILHDLIMHFQSLRPTWLLFDADWKHTKQAVPLLDQCSDVVSVGRLKWIPDSQHTGKDNCAWYRFDASHTGGPHFHPQQIVEAA